MSHSKVSKRGRSLYVDNWNPSAKKYINTCILCGTKGYSPSIEDTDFCYDLEHQAIYAELTRAFPCALDVDSYGRCEKCAKLLR